MSDAIPPATADPLVRHNPTASRYETEVAGELAFAEYVRRDGALVFTHTWVPPALRGRGLAEVLVRAALEEARRAHERIVPQCSYVARFIERHRDYADLLAPGT